MSKHDKDGLSDEHLRTLLDGHDIPSVDKKTKAEHLASAKQVFEINARKINQKNTQGSVQGGRLISITKLIGDFTMKKLYVAGGAVAMSVLAVSLMNTSMLTNVMPEVFESKDEFASITAALPETTRADKKGERSRLESQKQVAPLQEKIAGNLADAEMDAVAPHPPSFIPQQMPASAPAKSKDMVAKRAANFAAGNAQHSLSRIMPSPIPHDVVVQTPQYVGNDKFDDSEDNPVKVAKEEPVSTFSIDVDTASYSFVRRQLNAGVLPQKNAVRVEEMVNYFDYDYPQDASKGAPFSTHVNVYDSPWNTNNKLMHIGIKGFDIDKAEKPASNLVFLIDTSGSMSSPDKLPLLRNAFKMMVENMDENDTISIATYAGSAGVALQPTKVKDKQKIIAALENLRSGGSTAGAAGIKLAYQLAEQNFDEKAVNRVFIATDGDFNVGITNQDELKNFVEHKRESGVFLSVLGFGQGNYNDALMQTLAQNGNGTAAYIDTLSEARKLLVEESSSTLFTIAKDVKIQVEFNPYKVAEYRLIGYQTRKLNREDFNNDKVDAGEIGSGHTVTAIYEVTPTDAKNKQVDDLRYAAPDAATNAQQKPSNEWGFVKLRYKLPKEDTSKLIELPVNASNEVNLDAASTDVRFSTAVAAFGQTLRGGRYLESFGYDDVIKLAQSAKGEDQFGYRAEFINLVRLAQSANKM